MVRRKSSSRRGAGSAPAEEGLEEHHQGIPGHSRADHRLDAAPCAVQIQQDKAVQAQHAEVQELPAVLEFPADLRRQPRLNPLEQNVRLHASHTFPSAKLDPRRSVV